MAVKAKAKDKAKTSAKKPKVKVEEVAEPTIEVKEESDEILFMVKLDSKRFEERTLEQTLALITGSVGVVSKIAIERHP